MTYYHTGSDAARPNKGEIEDTRHMVIHGVARAELIAALKRRPLPGMHEAIHGAIRRVTWMSRWWRFRAALKQLRSFW
jgi:hypothetical protein